MRERFVPVPIGPRAQRALQTLGSLRRVYFERAVLAAVKWEEARQRARHRAEVSRYRRLFGWTWELE
jgi:hypothetical protein